MKLTDWILAGATVVLVIVTGSLALFTKNLFGATQLVAKQTGELAAKTAELANDTVAANRLADIHHQNTLLPLVTPAQDFNKYVHVPSRILFANIGSGVAVNVRVQVLKLDNASVDSGLLPYGPLGAGKEQRLDLAIQGDYKSVEMLIEYESLFGTTGRGVYKLFLPPGGIEYVLGTSNQYVQKAAYSETPLPGDL